MLHRLVDAATVEAEIERVRSLSGAALRRRWQAEFGRPAPKSLTVDLLRRMIANRIQEEAFGTLDRATLELVDLTPDDLIQRLKEGKVYVPKQAERALEHFFSPANLTALRELALRRTA